MAGVFWMLVANAATILGAGALLRRLGTGQAAVDGVLFLLLRLALISLAVLVAGTAQVLQGWILGLAGLLSTAALLACRVPRPDWSLPKAHPLLLALAAVLAVRLLLQVWCFAPYLGDALSYRLPQMAGWIQAHGFTKEIGADVRAAFPAGFELIEAWWSVFLHHDALIEMAGVEFLLLAVAAGYALAKHLGLSERSAALGAAFVALTPTLQFQATSCLNDGAASALVLATAVLISARLPWGLILVGLGMGCGIKPTYGFAIPGLLLLAFFYRREPPQKAGSPAWIGASAALGLLLGVFWYARNGLFFGNPIYPFASTGAVVLEGNLHHQIGPGAGVLFENLRSMIDDRIGDRAGGAGALAPMSSGWGVASFSLGLPGLVFLSRSDRRYRVWAASLFVSLLFVFLLVAVDPWTCRFVLFFPALLAVCAAGLIERCPRLWPLSAAALFVLTLGTMIPEELAGHPIRALLQQPWRSRHASPLPPGDPARPVGILGTNPGPVYGFYGTDFSRRVLYLRTTSLAELLAKLEQEGSDLLYAPRDSTMIGEAVRTGRLFPVSPGFFSTRRPG